MKEYHIINSIKRNLKTSTTFSSIYVDTTNLSSMLGFNSNINSMSANLTVAQIPYKLSIDDYVNLYIANTSNNNKKYQ